MGAIALNDIATSRVSLFGAKANASKLAAASISAHTAQ
jgi:hypothetical protein